MIGPDGLASKNVATPNVTLMQSALPNDEKPYNRSFTLSKLYSHFWLQNDIQ